jgi:hypothetical protein
MCLRYSNRNLLIPTIILSNQYNDYKIKPTDPLFGLGANVALIFSGQYVRFVSKMRANLPPGVDPWGEFGCLS